MISYSEFVESCQFFIDKERQNLNSSWEETDLGNSPDHGYSLIKKRYCLNFPFKHNAADVDEEDTRILEDMEIMMQDDPLCFNNDSCETYLTEYHIVYSIAFQVPILYFNIWDKTGKLLSLTETWEILSQLKPEILKEKWQTITQGDHPLVGKPFYYFHPCNTEKMMHFLKSCSSDKEYIKNYIPNWLNIYGSCFGLSFSPEHIYTETG